ncbi:MAG: hypothetical protein ABSF09_06190 [Candidatus Bathyarchaeia archaeon]
MMTARKQIEAKNTASHFLISYNIVLNMLKAPCINRKFTTFQKPDRAGAEHVRFLNRMNQNIAKAES